MASGQNNLYSTPTFELFRRGLLTQTVRIFRGINAYQSQAALGPDWALDCLNVMAPGWGGLSKFRLPVIMDGGGVGPSGPTSFFDYQQGSGIRQIVAAVGTSLYYYNWATSTTLSAPTLIETDPTDVGSWSMVESNNLMYMANGVRMVKWDGSHLALVPWSIAAPTLNLTIGSAGLLLSSIQRAGNVVTFTIRNTAAAPARFASMYLQVGNLVTINNPSDASFNGTFAIASVITPGLSYTYAQVAANAGPFVNVAVVSAATSSGVVPNVTGSRTAGIASYSWTPQLEIDVNTVPGTLVTISGFADATLNGTFEVATAVPGNQNGVSFNTPTAAITVIQPGLPDSAGGVNGTATFGVTITVSRSYAESITDQQGASSNIGPILTVNGPLTNRIIYVNVDANSQLFASIDGGGDLFFDPSAPSIHGTIIHDYIQDGNLDLPIPAPLVNNPVPVGKYLAVGQNRIFIANLVGAPNQIAYTGYEQILFGRPEAVSPPNNRLRLEIGAESIAGIGIMRQGIVGFSNTKRMYMLRGQVEDITVSSPIQFSSFLEELPWDIGTLCHQSIQSTPYGLLFWASDRTVQIFDGRNKPQDVSGPVYPLLRRATQGLEAQAVGMYFNWLERDWYGLTLSIDGSLVNNLTIFWSLQQSSDGNQVDIFPTSFQCDFVNVLSTPTGQRVMAISQGGRIKNLPVSQDTTGGLGDPTIIAPTAGKLGAFWKGGYFGNDTPQRSKMFRYGLLAADQDGFNVLESIIDDREHTFKNPLVFGPVKVDKSSFSINRRGKRCSIQITFPPDDVSSNVLEYSVTSIPTSDRR